MNPLQEVKDPITDFFTSLGYTVSWDFKRTTGERWYEIMIDGELVVQVDMGVPLAHIVEDFTAFSRGRKGTSPSDYKISGPDSDELNKLFNKVAKAGSS